MPAVKHHLVRLHASKLSALKQTPGKTLRGLAINAVLISTKGQTLPPVVVGKTLSLTPGVQVKVKDSDKGAQIPPASFIKTASPERFHTLPKHDGPKVSKNCVFNRSRAERTL